MKNQILVEGRSLHLFVEARVEEHHIDLGAGAQAKECHFCHDQTLSVVAEVDQIEGQWWWWWWPVMEAAEALEAVEEQVVEVQVLVVELAAASLPAASQPRGVLLRKRPIEQTGVLAD